MPQEKYTNSAQDFVDNLHACLRIQDDDTRATYFFNILSEFYQKTESPEKYNIYDLIKEDPVLIKVHALFHMRLKLATSIKVFEKENDINEYSNLVYDLFAGMYEEAFLDFHKPYFICAEDIDDTWASMLRRGIIKQPISLKIQEKLNERIALKHGQFIA